VQENYKSNTIILNRFAAQASNMNALFFTGKIFQSFLALLVLITAMAAVMM
jgi:hypothetical protein